MIFDKVCVHVRGRTGTESIGITGSTKSTIVKKTMDCYQWNNIEWQAGSEFKVSFLNDGRDPLGENRDVFIEKVELEIDGFGPLEWATKTDGIGDQLGTHVKGVWIPGLGCLPRTRVSDITKPFIDAGWLHCGGYYDIGEMLTTELAVEPGPEPEEPHECELKTFTLEEVVDELAARMAQVSPSERLGVIVDLLLRSDTVSP